MRSSNLLAISFEETDAPSGTATLIFAEGGAIQIDVECVEMQMKDVGPVWAADGRPTHDDRSGGASLMPQRLDAREPSFPQAFAGLLSAKREISEDVDQAVRAIIDEVVARGDEALVDVHANDSTT